MNRALVVILATVVLDMIGVGLIFPILPSLLRELTGSGEVSALYGVMLASCAAMQFIIGPVLGTLSDRFGQDSRLTTHLPIKAAILPNFGPESAGFQHEKGF